MNVYVRELVSSLAQLGVDCTTFTRADRPGLPEVVQIEPGHRVVHVAAGPHDLAKEDLPGVVDEFTAGVRRHLDGEFPADVVHANYWLSGLVAHRLKHERGLPFVTTFHTLAKVKAEGGDREPELRERAEAEIIGCADAICVNCDEEERQFRRLYGDPPGRIAVIAPAGEHAVFAPGARAGARRALELPADRPVLLFVGR
ncbi:MAG: glycosyltransferase, partial [Actinomycetes bacterium]